MTELFANAKPSFAATLAKPRHHCPAASPLNRSNPGLGRASVRKLEAYIMVRPSKQRGKDCYRSVSSVSLRLPVELYSLRGTRIAPSIILSVFFSQFPFIHAHTRYSGMGRSNLIARMHGLEAYCPESWCFVGAGSKLPDWVPVAGRVISLLLNGSSPYYNNSHPFSSPYHLCTTPICFSRTSYTWHLISLSSIHHGSTKEKRVGQLGGRRRQAKAGGLDPYPTFLLREGAGHT